MHDLICKPDLRNSPQKQLQHTSPIVLGRAAQCCPTLLGSLVEWFVQLQLLLVQLRTAGELWLASRLKRKWLR